MKKLNQMKLALWVLSAAFLASCSSLGSSTGYSATSVSYSVPSASLTSVADDISGDVRVNFEGGGAVLEDGVLKISSYGVYTLSGKMEGQIYIDVEESDSDNDVVELDLNGFSLSCSSDPPIYMVSGNELKIKAEKDTDNFIHDNRSALTSEDDDQGKGAIYAKADTKFVGKGSLNIEANYYNGIHVTKDVKIKNLSLSVEAYNHGIKGNDSITVESGNVSVVAYNGDGLHSENTDISSSGAQRGNINLSGGNITLLAGGDGIDAAYNVEIESGQDDDGNSTSPSLVIYTSKYANAIDSNVVVSSSSKKFGSAFGPGGNPGGQPGGQSENTDKSNESAKGIKAENKILYSDGACSIYAYDDGLHANYGTTLENGSKGAGDIEISGGTLVISCSDDGIHADSYLKISGGNVRVDTSHEGLEGNQILLSGGNAIVYGSDDAVNASKGDSGYLTPLINVSGGYLFAAVSANGDVDAVDSNGSYVQSGGVVITCGPNSGMAAALDSETTNTVSGGTLVCFGSVEQSVNYGSLTATNLNGSYSGNAAYKLVFANGSIETATMPNSTYSSIHAYSNLGKLSSVTKIS